MYTESPKYIKRTEKRKREKISPILPSLILIIRVSINQLLYTLRSSYQKFGCNFGTLDNCLYNQCCSTALSHSLFFFFLLLLLLSPLYFFFSFRSALYYNSKPMHETATALACHDFYLSYIYLKCTTASPYIPIPRNTNEAKRFKKD